MEEQKKMNTKLIKAMKLLSEANELINVVVAGRTPSKEEKSNVVDLPVAESPEQRIEATPITEEILDEMAFLDLKALAKSMDIPSTGSKKNIAKRILAAQPEPVEEEVVEDASVGHEQLVEERLERETKEMTDAEIKSFLTDYEVKIPRRAKRQALMALLLQNVLDGKIVLEEEDNENVDEEVELEEKSDNDVEDEDIDPLNPTTMTPERRDTCEAIDKEIRADYKNKIISDKDVDEALEGYENIDKDLSKEEKFEEYLALAKMMVDDDGNEVEEATLYIVCGFNCCCGRPVTQHPEDKDVYLCELCGEEYSNEEPND